MGRKIFLIIWSTRNLSYKPMKQHLNTSVVHSCKHKSVTPGVREQSRMTYEQHLFSQNPRNINCATSRTQRSNRYFPYRGVGCQQKGYEK